MDAQSQARIRVILSVLAALGCPLSAQEKAAPAGDAKGPVRYKIDDLLRSIAFGLKGEVYLVGKTASDDLPVTAGAAQTKGKGGLDAFAVKLVRAR